MSDPADRVAARLERRLAKADRLDGWAVSAARQSDAALAAAHRTADMIPLGQPMIVDSSGYGADRRRRARMRANFDKGHQLDAKARRHAERADSIRRFEALRLTAPLTIRRIGRLEADERRLIRDYLTACPMSGRRVHDAAARERLGAGPVTCPRCYQPVTLRAGADVTVVPVHGRVTGSARHAAFTQWRALRGELDYWRAHLAGLEADGVKVWGRADFRPGDVVTVAGHPHRVLRVNAKSVTVPHWIQGHTQTVPFASITGRQ